MCNEGDKGASIWDATQGFFLMFLFQVETICNTQTPTPTEKYGERMPHTNRTDSIRSKYRNN